MATIRPPEHISTLQGDRLGVRPENGLSREKLVRVEQIGDRVPVLLLGEAAGIVERHRPADVVVEPLRRFVGGDPLIASDQHGSGSAFALLAVALRAFGCVDVAPGGDLVFLRCGRAVLAVAVAATPGANYEERERSAGGGQTPQSWSGGGG